MILQARLRVHCGPAASLAPRVSRRSHGCSHVGKWVGGPHVNNCPSTSPSPTELPLTKEEVLCEAGGATARDALSAVEEALRWAQKALPAFRVTIAHQMVGFLSQPPTPSTAKAQTCQRLDLGAHAIGGAGLCHLCHLLACGNLFGLPGVAGLQRQGGDAALGHPAVAAGDRGPVKER